MNDLVKRVDQGLESLRVFLEAEVRRLLHENKVTTTQLQEATGVLPVGVEVLLAPRMTIEKCLFIAVSFGWQLQLSLNRPITLTCKCCEHTQTFAGPEEAFTAGWDCPPHFTGPITCDLCPSALVLMPDSSIAIQHRARHEEWKVSGRPGKFRNETCL